MIEYNNFGGDEIMQRTPLSTFAAIAVAGLFLAGCAANKMKKEDESGYLGDSASYEDLTEM